MKDKNILSVEDIRLMIKKEVEEQLDILNIKSKVDVYYKERIPLDGLPSQSIEPDLYHFTIDVVFVKYGKTNTANKVLYIDFPIIHNMDIHAIKQYVFDVSKEISTSVFYRILAIKRDRYLNYK